MSATPEQIAETTDLNELRAEVSWLEMRLGEVHKQRIEAETVARAQAERVRVLEIALAEIAKQVPAKDMDEDYYEAADFEDGYDRCVFAARAALKAAP